MERLSYQTLKLAGYNGYLLEKAPVRVLQFGEGVFLRGFVDYFFDVLNEKGLFFGKAVVIQPLSEGRGEDINRQDGLYTLYLRGLENGEKCSVKRVISFIDRVINPYSDPQAFYDCAKNADLRFITSNTTEAGIRFCENDCFGDMNGTFPAKLTMFLYERYLHFGNIPGKGFIILSCELIDSNGAILKEYVLKYAKMWQLPETFLRWVEEENVFCSTLVDRIITGYPHAEAAQMNEENNYEDCVIDMGEVFALWTIEGPDWMKAELPFEAAGLPAYIVPSQAKYKKRKVRILNGSQTGTTLAAYLSGLDLEREYMNDPTFVSFVRKLMYDEVIPATDLDHDDMVAFADSCIERLSNPFIDHRLFDISLNTVTKMRTRVLPSIVDHFAKFGKLPAALTFSFAAMLAFYRCQEIGGHFYGKRGDETYEVRDDLDAMKFFAEKSKLPNDRYVHAYVTEKKFHNTDFADCLPGFEAQVLEDLNMIDALGMRRAVEEVIKQH